MYREDTVKKILKRGLLLLLSGFCLAGISACENTDKEKTENFSEIPSEFFIENGYYTVGIDLPAGICDISATSGYGNILCSKDGTIDTYSAYEDDLNQALGTESSELPIENITNYSLKEGYTIHISGAVRAKIKYSKIFSNYTGRNYEQESPLILKHGVYTVGQDISAGIYTIAAIEGNGSITSSNALTLGIDELFGVFDGTEAYVPKAVNITLNEGDTLQLINITASLVKEVQ